MRRWLSSTLVVGVLLALVVLLAPPARAAEWREDPQIASAAVVLKKQLESRIAPAQRTPNRITAWRQDGDAAARGQRWGDAVRFHELTVAHAVGGGEGLSWLRLAQAYAGAGNGAAASAAAYNSWKISTDPVERGAALHVIGREYDKQGKFRLAFDSFAAGLALADSRAVRERFEQLREMFAFRAEKFELATRGDSATACVRFNEDLAPITPAALTPLIKVQPTIRTTVTARGKLLCIAGLQPGTRYEVRIDAALTAASGARLAGPITATADVGDLGRKVSFAGTGYVLPRVGSAGLPVTSVNLEKLAVTLLRVPERGMVPAIRGESMDMTHTGWSLAQLRRDAASLIWQGEMSVADAAARNRPVTTAIPLDKMLKDRKPGIYLAIAEPVGASTFKANLQSDEESEEEASYDSVATNWVLVSDLGLSAISGRDGLAITARSLDTAKPLAGVELTLLSRANEELANVRTDSGGVAHFPAAIARGRGADAPFAVIARHDFDFNFLELHRPALDLSAMGVDGRRLPEAVDGFVYTDRGIYRPGEKIQIGALLRERSGDAAKAGAVLIVLKPDGVEALRQSLPDGAPGGLHHVTLPTGKAARLGTWSIQLHLDPTAPALAKTEVLVEDFVPPTVELTATAPDAPLLANGELPIAARAAYYYGAPAAGLGTTADITLAKATDPYKGYEDWQFGRVQEEFSATRGEISTEPTGEDGGFTVTAKIDEVPSTSLPLEAAIRVTVLESSGRPVTKLLRRPLRIGTAALGLKAPEAVEEGQKVTVQAIALDPAGKPLAAPGGEYQLVREIWTYRWYQSDGRWTMTPDVSDEPLDIGALPIPASGSASLSFDDLRWGNYRLEVSDAASGAKSSIRFRVGWWVGATPPSQPDRLEARFERSSTKPGDPAKLYLKAPFAGTAQVALATDRILKTYQVDLPADGTIVAIDTQEDWGAGLYALVTAYRPLANGQGRGPVRAAGAAWLGLERPARTVKVAMSLPEIVRPRTRLDVPLVIEGLPAGATANLTLAAVDDAVLNLTDFQTPRPETHFHGKFRLGVDLRDLYGRLIDPRSQGVGELRQGGDLLSRRNRDLPDKSNEVVALFSGIVKVGPDGKASVPLALPDFNGRLRLMAVVATDRAIGAGEGRVVVRDTLVSQLALPRFLAIEDRAALSLSLNPIDTPPGTYKISVAAEAPLALAAPFAKSVALKPGQRWSDAVQVTGTGTGTGQLALTIEGPDGGKLERRFKIGVRAGQPIIEQRLTAQMQPGELLRLTDQGAEKFLPGSAELLVTLSPRPDWNVAGLLKRLSLYPYGCLEQLTSRAAPLVYAADAATAWGLSLGEAPDAALRQILAGILDKQRQDGLFGLWSSEGTVHPWLSAYAMDLLLDAQGRGVPLPDLAIRNGLVGLRNLVRVDDRKANNLPALAYAHFVLAKAKAPEVALLRSLADRSLPAIPTALARAQVGAALDLIGDQERARGVMRVALAAPGKPADWRGLEDYGSELRNEAGLLAFAAATAPRLGGEDGLAAQRRVTGLIEGIAARIAQASGTSTQEQAWLLRAAARFGKAEMRLAFDGGAAQSLTELRVIRRPLGAGMGEQSVANAGTNPVWRTVAVSGVPKDLLPAERNGIEMSRKILGLDGKPIDLNKVKQSALAVVLIEGARAGDQAGGGPLLVADLLPAGFEIESSKFGDGPGAGDFGWLGELTAPSYTEERDDRFVAAFEPGWKSFRTAYIVRAVTPGSYILPGTLAEDMIESQVNARLATGRITVLP